MGCGDYSSSKPKPSGCGSNEIDDSGLGKVISFRQNFVLMDQTIPNVYD